MIKLESELQGKRTYFGEMTDHSKSFGFTLGGAWEYHAGYFDTVLWRESGETIYVRLPFNVVKGMLDHRNALIEFEQPYIIKHVVHIGLDRDADSLLAATGFAQFQEPVDRDGYIEDKSKWELAGKEMINCVLNAVPFHRT
ncbi:YugN family protein [Pseudogracilibacillus auburnensis]|uniref:YugN family protein n=1 Tax=Pseudogracilibacillus auburnensis TaxID=1494959 RepID=UPI001A9754FB|nr:YugN family protein [Pseudogracilibacillus auburnensis]MBO1004861.1 hypothetical protein [Pseudogracilibacillus auburnensis]